MKYKVIVSEGTVKDINDIWTYIALNDSMENADYVLAGLENSVKFLERSPHKGHIPLELERISVLNYLEVHFKPYRIIYSVEGMSVYVFCVIDGRRNVQSIMNRRFLRW